MKTLRFLFLSDRRQAAVVAALLFATLVDGSLLAVRALYTGQDIHFGLGWNLFLAWIPMALSLLAYNLSAGRRPAGWILSAPCAALWLLFFPNAPYILTDMLHLRPTGSVPIWYDLIMLVAFAWTGAFLGLVSLYLLQGAVRRLLGAPAGWLFSLGVLLVTGFGVYLGRFPRWNSWDLLMQPVALLGALAARAQDPIANPRAIVFPLLFSLCLLAMYLVFVAAAQLRPGLEEG